MLENQTDPLDALVARWREEADTFRQYNADRLAAACERHAEQLEAARHTYRTAPLSPAQAAQESGYTADHIRRLIREDRIPTAGDSGNKVRRCDLPRKVAQGGRSTDPVTGSRTRVAHAVVNSDQEESDG